MPLPQRRISQDRLNIERSLTRAEIDSLVADRSLEVIQTSDRVDEETWGLLNECFFKVRPDVELRVYGFYGKTCDLAFLAKMGSVQRLAVDRLTKATNVECIARLPNLERLSVGIYELESFDFLRDLNVDLLTHLGLGATFSKKPRLRFIERFSSLQNLYLEGQCKDIEVINSLAHLRDLTLRSITVPSLAFLRGLPELWSLDIKLGGTKNLDALPYLMGIKYLELWQVKGLSDLTPIGEMGELQFLFLQALRNVERLPSLSRLSALRRIYLENMKGLKDLSSLVTAPVLEELIHVSAHRAEPQQYADLLANGTLKRMLVGFGNARKSEELLAMMRSAGVHEYRHSAFTFS